MYTYRNLARSTASTSSGATAALLTSSVRMAVKTFWVNDEDSSSITNTTDNDNTNNNTHNHHNRNSIHML